ncbi:tryptophan-rich sensory protein [Flavobacteriaceae bacterium F08102]|nr:tryptophan-rich sensory protein [Flavobacteriaceae bacterium F08102]
MEIRKKFFYFLLINFAALAMGGILMGNGPQDSWYLELNTAPWTPPGWVFGAAWGLIMLCFSGYMGFVYHILPSKKLISLFSIQWILNVSWNYLFFNQHLILGGLVIITLLTLLILYFLITYRSLLNVKTLLIVPYFLWLIIATSLNLYIFLYN